MLGWQFHLYLLIEGKNDDHLQTAVKEAFPRNRRRSRRTILWRSPTRLKSVTYAYKADN